MVQFGIEPASLAPQANVVSIGQNLSVKLIPYRKSSLQHQLEMKKFAIVRAPTADEVV